MGSACPRAVLFQHKDSPLSSVRDIAMMDFCLLSILFYFFLRGRTVTDGPERENLEYGQQKTRAFSPFCGHVFLVLPFCCINNLVQPEVSCSRSRAPAGHPGAQRAQLCHLGPCLKSSAAGVGAKPRSNSQGLPYGQASASNVREASLGLDLQRHLPKVSKGGK